HRTSDKAPILPFWAKAMTVYVRPEMMQAVAAYKTVFFRRISFDTSVPASNESTYKPGIMNMLACHVRIDNVVSKPANIGETRELVLNSTAMLAVANMAARVMYAASVLKSQYAKELARKAVPAIAANLLSVTRL